MLFSIQCTRNLIFFFHFLVFVGRRFAEQEMYVLIMKLLKNFKLQWKNEGKMEQNYNMLLKPDIPCRIAFEPRK